MNTAGLPLPRPAWLRCLPLLLATMLALTAKPAPAAVQDLLDMSDKLDQLDRLDFEDLLSRAGACTSARNFSCADQQLTKAARLGTTENARTALQRARQVLAAAIEQVEQERRALAQRMRDIELAEARLKEQEEEAERAADRARRAESQADSSMSTAQGIALFGSLLGQSMAQQRAFQAAEALRGQRIQRELYASVPDGARQQQRFAAERERLQSQMADLRRQRTQVAQAPQTPAAAAQRPAAPTQPAPQTQQAALAQRPSQQPPATTAPPSSSLSPSPGPQPQTLAEVQARIRQLQTESEGQRGQPSQQPPAKVTSVTGTIGNGRADSQGSSSGAGGAAQLEHVAQAPSKPQVEGPTGCMSYGTFIPTGQSVCYESTMLQYRCSLWRHKVGFTYVQKLLTKIDPNDKICYHVDRQNQRPTRETMEDLG